jgi:hypothetical protein
MSRDDARAMVADGLAVSRALRALPTMSAAESQNRRGALEGFRESSESGSMSKMKLQHWSELSQVVSAVAVVISLVYVAMEIRGNTEATRAATRQAISQTDLDFISAPLDAGILLVAQSKERQGLEVDGVELLALITHQHVNFRVFENAFYQHRAGLLEGERWETYRWIISLLFATTPSADSMWTAYEQSFDSEFRDTVTLIRSEPFKPRRRGGAP